jgi:hypothetical protein
VFGQETPSGRKKPESAKATSKSVGISPVGAAFRPRRSKLTASPQKNLLADNVTPGVMPR